VDRDDPAYKGQADYTRPLLKAYDRVVLGPVARFVWRCPADRLTDGYRAHIGRRHLDIGPGTGYFLVRAGLGETSAVTLVDPNQNVLQHASRRLQAFNINVTALEADVCKPLPVQGPFDSAALNLVLHCLPGPRSRKAAAVANVAACLAPTGVLFGASVLGIPGPHTRLARGVLAAFNRKGSFDNLEDTEVVLREILEASFGQVTIEIIGSIAVFSATGPISGR
jgi:SAM-dependent methyltransferase